MAYESAYGEYFVASVYGFNDIKASVGEDNNSIVFFMKDETTPFNVLNKVFGEPSLEKDLLNIFD